MINAFNRVSILSHHPVTTGPLAHVPDLVEQLRAVVAWCPSGALQIHEHPGFE